MPKIIELTVEIDVQRVSCPGVWLCQDGRVSLTVFALGTSYQTCLLPPIFPLLFKDIFYFRKRFQESCALNNICCLLKEETIYCELVQWCDDCASSECVILAQYLGALNDVLFPPNMCSNDGVDLLMRRAKDFPGILSPKIEIATKVRIDEVWNQSHTAPSSLKVACHCSPRDETARQRQVCHSARYHRNKCFKHARAPSGPLRSGSRSGSSGSKSCCSLMQNDADYMTACDCPVSMSSTEKPYSNRHEEEKQKKTTLESRYIDYDRYTNASTQDKRKNHFKTKITPCVCEICKRYHELFHTNKA
ncbi:spermatogenesis-associated protein 6 isoform X2 [Spodoptera frugiperda]|uniref:Spermatogenesis-associated protein 6 isoform X2 n=1 Tax=Spodoptera frugiperda TaxID=7108 RepID=A0A9R0ETJ1_SPOFR|nr:spermatogenesis-associated protein 6 isoform X2 [Spodoptera frugiperda]